MIANMPYKVYTCTVSECAQETRRVDSAVDALVLSANEYLAINVPFMCSVHPDLTAEDLFGLRDKGLMYQDPAYFENGKVPYNAMEGWVLAQQYLVGRIPDLLHEAEEMNKVFCGAFNANIKALRAVCPKDPAFEDLHCDLGDPWVPERVIELFVEDLLNTHDVHVSREHLSGIANLTVRSKIEEIRLQKDLLNTTTYGYITEVPDPLSPTGSSRKGYTALEIISQYLKRYPIEWNEPYYEISSNGKSVRKYRTDPEMTKALQNALHTILDAFYRFTTENNEAASMIYDAYLGKMAGYAHVDYNGDIFALKDLNSDVVLRPNQRKGLAMALLGPSRMLLAHSPGSGKTYVLLCAAHELHRTGVSPKNLIVVPKQKVMDFEHDARYLFPNDNILVVYGKDFTPGKRNATMMKIRNGDYSAIIMAHSTFDLMTVSKRGRLRLMDEEVASVKSAIFDTGDATLRAILNSRLQRLNKQRKKLIQDTSPELYLKYDLLGISCLMIDECQHYKNISKDAGLDVVGMNAAGSKKADDALMKANLTDRLILSTGTPIANSLTDVHTWQQYLMPNVLRAHSIYECSSWIRAFATCSARFEVDETGSTGAFGKHIDTFENLPELSMMMGNAVDFFLDSPEVNEALPMPHYETVSVPKGPKLKLYTDALVDRAKLVRSNHVLPTEDNILKIISDAGKASLDLRLLGQDHEAGKLEYCRDKIIDMYYRFPGTAQVVFCDLGIPGGNTGFSIYDELKSMLIDCGMKPDEIAFIHDAKTDRQRDRLLQKVDEAGIRVLITSIKKGGEGCNYQKKLIATHLLTTPWRPSDVVQAEGRCIREGNDNKDVFIFRYVTEGTLDAFRWQKLETKLRATTAFLGSFLTRRSLEELDTNVFTYGEIKAAASGNPLVRERLRLMAELDKAMTASGSRECQLREMEQVLLEAPEAIRSLKEELSVIELDAALYHRKKSKITSEERKAIGNRILSALQKNLFREDERFLIAYQGFSVMLPAGMTAEYPHIIIRSRNKGSYAISMQKAETALGCCQRIDYLLNHLPDRQTATANRIADWIEKQRIAETDLLAGNPHTEIVNELNRKIARIDCELMDTKTDEEE